MYPWSEPVGEFPQALLRCDEAGLTAALGRPHDGTGPGDPGPSSYWYLEFDDGLRVMIQFMHGRGYANVTSNTPQLAGLERRLGLPSDLGPLIPIDWQRDA